MIEIQCIVNEKIIIETLSRIGIADRKNKILYPSCYLFKKDEKNFIVHFKELFLLRDDGYDNFSETDFVRTCSIINCLYEWNMIDVDLDKIEPCDSFVFILPYADKKNWIIKHKYSLRYNRSE